MSLIQLNGICRHYGTKDKRTTVLRDLDLQINEGDMLAIRGKSGSGKTTLLNILGGIMPLALSGGEKQRVAIGRALIRNPDILLCDEPTGALDEETGKQILSLFGKLHEDGKTLVIVTHDDSVAATCSRQVHIRDGQIADPM